MIIWKEAYETGHPIIDEEHQELVAQLNRLEEALKAGQGQTEIQGLLEYLDQYARNHFFREEHCMTVHQCPSALENKKAHAVFIRMFGEARLRLAEKGAALAIVLEVHRNLSEWVRKHILTIDCQLRACLKD